MPPVPSEDAPPESTDEVPGDLEEPVTPEPGETKPAFDEPTTGQGVRSQPLTISVFALLVLAVGALLGTGYRRR